MEQTAYTNTKPAPSSSSSSSSAFSSAFSSSSSTMGWFSNRLSVWFLVLFFCFCLSGNRVRASHGVFLQYQSTETSSAVEDYRTGYHFQPPKNWINDPNGPMYYNGIYHLFYQYNPKGSVWGNIVWAHSVSTDLINWKPLDPAIYPSKPFDENGCWSGSVTFLPGNKPVILYTGIDPENRQVQNLAYPKDLSDPYLREWVKPDHNPVMAPTAKNGINASSFRDPTTAWLGPDGAWRVIVGSKKMRRGLAILYRSRDFLNWVKAKHPLHSARGTGMWECPDFYPVSKTGTNGLDTSVIGDHVKHVLKVSLDDTKFEYYTVGKYFPKTDRYVPDNTSADDATGLRYDYGKFYASKTFFDTGKNRRLLWGWMNESDSVPDDVAKGWAGLQCIPRTVWLDKSGKQVIQWPIKEVESLRKNPVRAQNIVLKKGDLYEIKGITAVQADVDIKFKLKGLEKAEPLDPSWTNPQILCNKKGVNAEGGLGPFGLLVLASNGLEEYTGVYFRVFKSDHRHVVLMCSDQSRSTLQDDADKTTYGGFVDVDLENGELSLRSLIDNSIVESFGGGGKTVITARVYPTKVLNSQAHLYAFNKGSEAVKISSVEAWSMKTAKIN